jgi:hypothetical protein
MKPHYFEQEEADKDDFPLFMAKTQGYAPQTCLLNGIVVMDAIQSGRHPCDGCMGPRDKCKGRPLSDFAHLELQRLKQTYRTEEGNDQG